ncbi:hypothetical protein, partial [Pseudomonas sp. ME-P-057]|uniref:hypothetical protein n=1 Tax=Pseudomonas sp. ME-P-057 TaxID=3040321 RepID=UPI0025565A49
REQLQFRDVTPDVFPAKAGPTSACGQWDRLQPGRGQLEYPKTYGAAPDAFPAKAGPTKGKKAMNQP